MKESLFSDVLETLARSVAEEEVRSSQQKNEGEFDRAAVTVPPYYPDIPLVREEIAHHYDCILKTDEQVGAIVGALQDEGLYENTYVMLHSDHGYKLHRHKQFLYEGGKIGRAHV